MTSNVLVSQIVWIFVNTSIFNFFSSPYYNFNFSSHFFLDIYKYMKKLYDTDILSTEKATQLVRFDTENEII